MRDRPTRYELVGAGLLAALIGLGFIALPVGAHTNVNISVNVGGAPYAPSFVAYGPPELVVVPETGVWYAPRIRRADVYRVGPEWFAYWDGYWYEADAYSGPWVVVSSVPREVYYAPAGYYQFHHVPPGQWKKFYARGPRRGYVRRDYSSAPPYYGTRGAYRPEVQGGRPAWKHGGAGPVGGGPGHGAGGGNGHGHGGGENGHGHGHGGD